MATAVLKIIQGDTRPNVNATLLLDNAAVNLTGATVTLRRKPPGGTVTVVPVTIISAIAGTVRYVWTVGETAAMALGPHTAEFRVVFPDPAEIISFPDCDDEFVIEVCDEV